jgi:guanylate kinase
MKKLLILDIDHTVTDPHDPAYDTPLDELFYNHPKVASISINKRFVNWYNERFPFDDIVFIEPSSIDVLRERLKERGDSTDSIDRRLSVAVSEMAHKSYYDRVICNNDIKTAYKELKRCIDGNQLLFN